MKTEIKEIPFNGSILLGVRTVDGQIWLAVKKCCLDIGLSEGQAQRQIANIQKDLVFDGAVENLNCKFATQVRKTVCIKEKFVTLWLAKVSLTPSMQKKNPEAVQKLLTYQLEAAEVLHKAFYGTEEQKTTFNERMGLEGKIEDMQIQIKGMEDMMREQMGKFDSIMDNMTLSTRQQQKLYKAAKDRVNHLLGGAHSLEYKKNAKSYFINLWNGLKSLYGCASYKDLNPRYYDAAFKYISLWEYVDV